ncbi:MAG: histidine phosphatase family protein [Negativicutes bacterium]|nr:histidine phosphatase family protein [Negativicutes bacterium]
MELVLMRHGKAEERGSRLQDDERELTAKGREKTMAAAKGLMALLDPGVPVTIWTSPVKRALQTAELVAKAVKGVPVIAKKALASGSFDELSAELKEFDREGTLIIIGHEPYLSHWGARIGDVILPLKPSSAMAFTLTSLAPPEGRLQWYANWQMLKRFGALRLKTKKAKPEE